MIAPTPLRAFIVLLVLSSTAASAADGTLDTTFDGDGRQTIGFDLGQVNSDLARAVAQFPDGSVALAGDIQRATAGDFDFGVVVIEPDGAPDTDFSSDGKSTLFFDLGTHKADKPTAVHGMKDGRVVTCGTANYDVESSWEDRLVVGRHAANGAGDGTFGDSFNGKVVLSPFDHADSDALTCSSLVVHDDDRIVVPFTNWNYYEAGLIRLEADGDLDATFGGDGVSELAACSTEENACRFQEVLLLPDGKYLALGTKMVEVGPGSFASHLFVARYTSAGLLDSTFSGDGQAVVSLPANAIASGPIDAALDPQGRAVVLASTPGTASAYRVVRLTSSGTADVTFGTSGWAPIELRDPPDTQEVTGLLIQGDGKLVLSGSFQYSGADWDCGTMRLNASGTAVDATFGAAGRRSVAFDLGTTADTDLCYESSMADGRLVLAGGVRVGETYDFATARLTNAYIFIDGFESGSPFFWSAKVP